MNEIVPTVTVKVKDSGHICNVNAVDFDEKIHVLVEGEVPGTTTTETPVGLNKNQIIERLKELKVEFKPTQKKEELEALLEDAEAKASEQKPALRIEPKGDKFVILNATDEQQGDEFNKIEDAEAMMALLGAN